MLLERIIVESMLEPGKRYLIPYARPGGSEEYGLFYVDETGKFREENHWTDPMAVGLLNTARVRSDRFSI